MVLRKDNSPSSTPLGVTVRRLGLTFLFVLLSFFSFAQTFPVTINTTLTPPYTGYLLDYADPASEKLKVMIQFNDFTVPQYNVKLKFEIKGNGFSMVTKSIYNVPITLTPGSPTVLSGDALFPFLNSDNLDFLGINQSWYEQRKILPEGSYTICVTAYDAEFQPGKQVSNEACAMAWFTLSDPPLLNIPLCNSVISQQTPQNIVFQWTSMNLGSPNSSNSTEYVFQLWEMRDTTVSPDVIAHSSMPIFEQTTQQTTLVYGPGESPLSPYAKYVWRVQAKDQSGRDLFKNNGYSQACTFKNGDMAEEIGNSIHLELTGQAVSHRLAKCSWEMNNMLDSYLLQVRKEGTANWFDFETTANNEKIPNLEPSTTYEARLQGKSSVNGITTEWSNTVSFTTLAPPNYTCNDQNAPVDALQAQPLAAIKAKPGLIIQSGQFEVFATSITPNGTPGWYKGTGNVYVFGMLPLAVKWDNIYIDDNNRHQQGQIDALSKGIESFVHQYDVNQGEENAIYVPEGTLDSVYAANGQVCYSLSGSDSSVCADYPPNTNVVVVRDGEGNQYVVTIYPEPATVEGPFNYIEFSGDSLSSSSNRQVTFAASATQNYGFDAREVSAWTENYEAIKMKDGENYFVPFKSVGENQTDEVTATIQIEGYDATFLSFKTKSGAVLAHTAAGSNKFKLSVPANAEAVYAWYGTEKLGKLNVKSLKALTRKVVIVPVNNTAYSTTNVVDSLNKTYKQANVSWTATTAQSFTFDLGTDGLEAADATLFSKYSTEMRALRDAYIAHDSTYDKNAYYLFVVPKFTDASQVGYMVRGKGLGFITPSAKIRDIAHELGHGSFGLEHTFPNPPQGSTANLMDYSQGSQLTQKQWDKIHSPMPVISWLDGEEDGSFASDYVLSPDYKLISVNSTMICKGYTKNADIKYGCLAGYCVEKNGKQYIYSWNGLNYYCNTYKQDGKIIKVSTPITDDLPIQVTNPKSDRHVGLFLYWNNGCGSKFFVMTPYSSISSILATTQKEEISKMLLDYVTKLPESKFQSIPCKEVQSSSKYKEADNFAIDCSANEIASIIASNLQAINSINSNTSAQQVNQILQTNYSICVFESLTSEKRKIILNILLDKNSLKDFWDFEKDGNDVSIINTILETSMDKTGMLSYLHENPSFVNRIYDDIDSDFKDHFMKILLKLCFTSGNNLGLQEIAYSVIGLRIGDVEKWGHYLTNNKIENEAYFEGNKIVFIEKNRQVADWQYSLTNIIKDLVGFNTQELFKADPFQLIVTQYADASFGNNAEVAVKLPAIYVKYLLDNSEKRQTINELKSIGGTALNLAMFFVGVGEIQASLRAMTSGVNGIKITRLLLGSADLLSLGLGQVCENNESDFCTSYKQYELIINLGLLSANVITNLPKIYDDLYKGLADPSLNSAQKTGLRKVLGELDEAGAVVNGTGNIFKPLDELLTQFNSIIGNKGLKHIFRGEINSSGVASGVHHISAVRAGTAKIVPNTIEDLGNGFYKASVEVSDGAGGWVAKIEKSTFFPDVWDEVRVMEEIQSAANNRVGDFIENTASYQKYYGTSTSGQRVYIVRTPIYNNNIFTAWFEPL